MLVEQPSVTTELLARSACEAVAQRFTAEVDAGRASDAIVLFEDDAVLELGGRTYSGRAEIATFLADRSGRTRRRTRHLTANFGFRLERPDRGEAQALLVVFVGDGDEAPSPAPAVVSDCSIVFRHHPETGWLMAERRHRRFASV